MEETYITFETSKLALEKGFNGYQYSSFYANYYNCDGSVGNSLWQHLENKSPRYVTQSLLQKWLREKHNLIVSIIPRFFTTVFYEYRILGIEVEVNSYDSYEDALENGLKCALENIKNLNTDAE